MSAVTITFLGGPETGGVDSTTWGNDATGSVVFPLRVPVLIDPEGAKGKAQKELLTNIVSKARGNRFFKVEDGKADKAEKPVVTPAKAHAKRTVAEAKEADDAS